MTPRSLLRLAFLANLFLTSAFAQILPNEAYTALDITVRRNLRTKNLVVTGQVTLPGVLSNQTLSSGRYVVSADTSANAIPYRINAGSTAGFGQGATAGNPALIRGSAAQVEAANGATYARTELYIDRDGTGAESQVFMSGADSVDDAIAIKGFTEGGLVDGIGLYGPANTLTNGGSVPMFHATTNLQAVYNELYTDYGGTGTESKHLFSGPAGNGSSLINMASNQMVVSLASNPGSAASTASLSVTSAAASVPGSLAAGTVVRLSTTPETLAAAAAFAPHKSVVYVTGATAITSITMGPYPAGSILILINGAGGDVTGPVITDGNNIKATGGDFTLGPDDTWMAISDGTNFYELGRNAN